MKTKTIPMSAVKSSSQISSIGHDGDTLAVTFKSGGTYHYHGVTGAQFKAMKAAESMGKYLGDHIKPKHKFSKIG